MSLLDDARRIMHAGPATYGEWECVLCHRDGKDRLTHTDDCPWLAMPKIVKALEAGRALAGACKTRWMGKGDTGVSRLCRVCDSWIEEDGHIDGCQVQALNAAMEDAT